MGLLGIIMSDKPTRVHYPDGKLGRAWVGIHLTDGVGHSIGDPWSSRAPHVVGHVQ
jgi:hypothetical protein